MTPRAPSTTAAGWLQVGVGLFWGGLGVVLVVMAIRLLAGTGTSGEEFADTLAEAGPFAIFLIPLWFMQPMVGIVAGMAAVLAWIAGTVLALLGLWTSLLGRGVLRRSQFARRASIALFGLFTAFSLGLLGESEPPPVSFEVQGLPEPGPSDDARWPSGLIVAGNAGVLVLLLLPSTRRDFATPPA